MKNGKVGSSGAQRVIKGGAVCVTLHGFRSSQCALLVQGSKAVAHAAQMAHLAATLQQHHVAKLAAARVRLTGSWQVVALLACKLCTSSTSGQIMSRCDCSFLPFDANACADKLLHAKCNNVSMQNQQTTDCALSTWSERNLLRCSLLAGLQYQEPITIKALTRHHVLAGY